MVQNWVILFFLLKKPDDVSRFYLRTRALENCRLCVLEKYNYKSEPNITNQRRITCGVSSQRKYAIFFNSLQQNSVDAW